MRVCSNLNIKFIYVNTKPHFNIIKNTKNSIFINSCACLLRIFTYE